jgi:hypothetical protein
VKIVSGNGAQPLVRSADTGYGVILGMNVKAVLDLPPHERPLQLAGLDNELRRFDDTAATQVLLETLQGQLGPHGSELIGRVIATL